MDRANPSGHRVHCKLCWLALERERRAKRGPAYTAALRRKAYLKDPRRFYERQKAYLARRKLREAALKPEPTKKPGRPRKPRPLLTSQPTRPALVSAELHLRVRSSAEVEREIRQIERALRW